MGGKGDIDIDITGGAEPRDEYARVSDALPVEWASFEDGAGEVEEMLFGNWVDDGGPPWYYPFTEITLGDYDFFAFSLYLFFSNSVGSVGALVASGDYFIDLGNNRVYIYGYDGGGGPAAPTADGYCHAVSEQFTVAGAGQLVVLEDHYDSPGGMGVRRIGSFQPTYRTEGSVNTTAFRSINVFNFLNGRCYGLAMNSHAANQARVTPSRKGRGGFYYSEDDGATWHRATGELPIGVRSQAPSFEGDQPLYDEYVEKDLELGDPGYPGVYQWDMGNAGSGSEVPYHQSTDEMTRITNATQYNTPTGPIGFMPMSGDGTFGAFFTNKSPGNFFTTGHLHIPADIQEGQSYGKGWRQHAQIPYHASKPSLMGNGVISGNTLNLLAACRDARALVDPTTYGGNVFAITRNREVLKIPFDAVTWYGGSPTITKQYTLPGIASSVHSITSTYDPLTGKMWLHAFTRYNNHSGAEWGFFYSKSDDEGLSWTIVNFEATFDPEFNAGGWIQTETRRQYTMQFLVSPESQTLWLSLYSQKSFGFLSYQSIASHLYRSLDHGVTWDKISGNHPYGTQNNNGGWSRGADGFFRTPGAVMPVFLGDPLDGPPTELYIFVNQYFHNNVFHFTLNDQVGTHGNVLDSITFPAYAEEPHINGDPDEYGGMIVRNGNMEFNNQIQGDTFLDDHSPRYDFDRLPCGFQRFDSVPQKMNDYYFRFGGFGKHYTNGAYGRPTGCDQYNNNDWDRGDYIELSILPLDAVITGIADESGFIIRAQHVNELRQKLQLLNNTVQARGTTPTNFGIDVSDIPTVAQNKTPVRADHYGFLRREFDTKIRTITAVEPGGSWIYTDDGVDLTDAEYDMPTPIADGPDGVSIRTLLGMRKIIQSLYLNGWFCACYSYCPCQTDITISGGGSKK